MGNFAGLVRFDGAGIGIGAEQRLFRALERPGLAVQTQRTEGALFVRRVPAGTPRPSGDPFAATVRLDNRRELGGMLGLNSDALDCHSDCDLIAALFSRFGAAGIEQCLGKFAFAHWSGQARRLTLGVDCVLGQQLVFYRGAGFVAFATELRTLFALPEVPRKIDEIQLADLLSSHWYAAHETIYAGVERVRPRYLRICTAGAAREVEYWRPDLTAPPPYRRLDDFVAHGRALLDKVVETAIEGRSGLGVQLSGGLDSCAVAATVMRLRPDERLQSYTVVPPAGFDLPARPGMYIDEESKVRALGARYPALGMHFVAPSRRITVQAELEHLIRYQTPTPVASLGFGPRQGYIDASDGVRVLLSGVAGNAGFSWPGSLSLIALLQEGRFLSFAHDLNAIAHERSESLAASFARDVVRPLVPASWERALRRAAGRLGNEAFRTKAINPDFLAEARLQERWRARLGASADRLAGWDARRYRAHMLFDMPGPGTLGYAIDDNDEPFEHRAPLMDRRLSAFSLSVPERFFRHRGVSRSFARAVLADRVPPEILNETKRGTQHAAWFGSLSEARPIYAEEIERIAASPAACHLLNVPELKRLIDEWPAGAREAHARQSDYRFVLARGMHVGRFIRWVESGNA